MELPGVVFRYWRKQPVISFRAPCRHRHYVSRKCISVYRFAIFCIRLNFQTGSEVRPLRGGQVRLLLSPGKKRPKRWLLNSVKCQGWEWVELYLHPPIMYLHGMDRNNGTWPILHVSGRKARCFDSSMRIFKNCVSEFIKIWISRFFPRRLK